MAVGEAVNAQNHPREVYMKSRLVAAQKSTPGLTYMCAKTIKGYSKFRNMEDVANKKTLTIE